MGHWKKMIKITGDTDYYYCTIILSITCIWFPWHCNCSWHSYSVTLRQLKLYELRLW